MEQEAADRGAALSRPVDISAVRDTSPDEGETSTCLDYFAQHDGCAICIDVCPFSQKGFFELERRFKGRPDAPRFSVDIVP